MKHSLWRKCAIGVLCVALVNTGMMSAASAAIVDTSEIVTIDRAADLASIRAHLDSAEVRAQMEQMGIDAAAVDRRIAALNDRELHQLAADMRDAPAGGGQPVPRATAVAAAGVEPVDADHAAHRGVAVGPDDAAEAVAARLRVVGREAHRVTAPDVGERRGDVVHGHGLAGRELVVHLTAAVEREPRVGHADDRRVHGAGVARGRLRGAGGRASHHGAG